MKDWVNRVMDAALALEGSLYISPTEENKYSGKGLKNALYPNTYDCSGLVAKALFDASGGKIDWRADYNAQKMFDTCKPLPKESKIRPCLAFYGHGTNMISHVMLATPDGRVFGSCGGSFQTTTPEAAVRDAARVRYRPSVNYRDDFKGFRAIPELKGENNA